MVTAVLHRPTLVLNRYWQPVGVATVARALVKVWSDTARVVDPADYQVYRWADWAAWPPEEGQDCIATSRLRLRVPEVITLTTYDRLPTQVVTFNRRNIFKRDRFTCQYCGAQPGRAELSIDHIIPRSQGGVSNWDNCVLACVACNARKANRTPEQAAMPNSTRQTRPC
jgi:5-methylcytosine-specific restriction endonuclease McrA